MAVDVTLTLPRPARSRRLRMSRKRLSGQCGGEGGQVAGAGGAGFAGPISLRHPDHSSLPRTALAGA